MHLINANALRVQLSKQFESSVIFYAGKDREAIDEVIDAAIKNCEQFGIDSLNPRVHSDLN